MIGATSDVGVRDPIAIALVAQCRLRRNERAPMDKRIDDVLLEALGMLGADEPIGSICLQCVQRSNLQVVEHDGGESLRHNKKSFLLSSVIAALHVNKLTYIQGISTAKVNNLTFFILN